ncbi:hypothetical protein G7092_16305 [Mucilaginibacter sp. HC2]|uniref:bacteriocin-like protein n=1 Tax=Mucilaginibacter inviolabilis TaxID=2714892 RepID=UPI001408A68F|nr:hypothetical protein [Mucilaginibacter inviolabilis]NHA05373.1 hypothetical protein [Mucilaginibacter inviolabilis]
MENQKKLTREEMKQILGGKLEPECTTTSGCPTGSDCVIPAFDPSRAHCEETPVIP